MMKKKFAGIAVGASLIIGTPVVPVGEMKLVGQSIHECNEAPTYLPAIPGKKRVVVDRGFKDPILCDGSFSVATFVDSKGNMFYKTIPIETFANTNKKGGEQYNATKEEMASLISIALEKI